MKFESRKFGNIAELIKDQYSPTDTEELPYVGLEHIEQGTLRLNGVGKSNEVTSQKFRFKAGDILFGKLRPYFRKVYRPSFGGICSTDIWVIRAKNGVRQDFLHWLVASQQFVDAANAGSTGTRMPRASWHHLSETEWFVPEASSQEKFSSILNSIDSKIEINHLTNGTLEEIGRTLFKRWFVDFEFPNESGEPYRSSGGEMVDSELGEIPKGWVAVPMTEIFEVNSARKLGKGTVANYLDMGNMPTASYRPSVWVKREYTSGSKFMNGDTLLARITPCLENEKTAFVDFLEDGEVGWGSTEYIVLRSKPPLPLMYSYFLARSDEFRSYAFSNMTGSSGRQRVPTDCLEHYLTVRPSAQISSKFGDLIEALRLKASSCGEESRITTEMRDILLPKLLTGELVPTK